MDEDGVSVACEAHNMELPTTCEAKMDKDEVSVACEIGITHILRGENGQRPNQCFIRGSRYAITNHLRDEMGRRRGSLAFCKSLFPQF